MTLFFVYYIVSAFSLTADSLTGHEEHVAGGLYLCDVPKSRVPQLAFTTFWHAVLPPLCMCGMPQSTRPDPIRPFAQRMCGIQHSVKHLIWRISRWESIDLPQAPSANTTLAFLISSTLEQFVDRFPSGIRGHQRDY